MTTHNHTHAKQTSGRAKQIAQRAMKRVPTKRQARPQGMSRFAHFVQTHDEDPAFFWMYFILGFGLSFLFNMGFFVILAIAHFGLDYTKHRMLGMPKKQALKRAARESIVDIAFIFIGLVLGLYVHTAFTFGVAHAGRSLAVSQAARLNNLARIANIGRAAARAASAQRFVEAFTSLVLKRDDSGQLVMIDGKMTTVEKVFVGILIICVILLLASPWIVGVTPESFVNYVQAELIPRPGWRF